MKKVILFFALFAFVGLSTAQAQCTGKKMTDAKEKVCCTKTAAAKAAALDTEVEERVDASTGTVQYVRKSVCPQSGKVSYTEVSYCAESGKFINMAPTKKASCSSKAGAKKGCCSKKGAKASKGCCAKKSKAVQS